MELNFQDGNRKITIASEGLSQQVQRDLYKSFQQAIDKEHDLMDQKAYDGTQSQQETTSWYKEGYQALQTNKKGLHHPTSEFEKESSKEEANHPTYGVKTLPGGESRYQLFYICDSPVCSHKGKRYVPKGAMYTNCHDCGNRMKVRNATDDGFGYKDEYNNYYISGAFKKDYKNQSRTISAVQ